MSKEARNKAALGLALAVTLLSAPTRESHAAVALAASGRVSARNAANVTTMLNVPASTNAVLLVGVSVPAAATGLQITWDGVPLTRLSSTSAAPASCRVEIWYLPDPVSGNRRLNVTLGALSAFSVGAAVFSGVDRTSAPAVVPNLGSSTLISITAAATPIAGLFGAACASGNDNRGGAAAAGQTVLWDATEPNVVGLGAYRLLSPWQISWTLQTATSWASAGVVLNEAGGQPAPDGGATPDAGTAPDVSPPPPDVSTAPDVATPPPDAVQPRPDTTPSPPDATVPSDGRPADGMQSPSDGAQPGSDALAPVDTNVPGNSTDTSPGRPDAGSMGGDVDGASNLDPRAINLQVGCACEIGEGRMGGSFPNWLALLFGSFGLARRLARFRRRTAVPRTDETS